MSVERPYHITNKGRNAAVVTCLNIHAYPLASTCVTTPSYHRRSLRHHTYSRSPASAGEENSSWATAASGAAAAEAGPGASAAATALLAAGGRKRNCAVARSTRPSSPSSYTTWCFLQVGRQQQVARAEGLCAHNAQCFVLCIHSHVNAFRAGKASSTAACTPAHPVGVYSAMRPSCCCSTSSSSCSHTRTRWPTASAPCRRAACAGVRAASPAIALRWADPSSAPGPSPPSRVCRPKARRLRGA